MKYLINLAMLTLLACSSYQLHAMQEDSSKEALCNAARSLAKEAQNKRINIEDVELNLDLRIQLLCAEKEIYRKLKKIKNVDTTSSQQELQTAMDKARNALNVAVQKEDPAIKARKKVAIACVNALFANPQNSVCIRIDDPRKSEQTPPILHQHFNLGTMSEQEKEGLKDLVIYLSAHTHTNK